MFCTFHSVDSDRDSDARRFALTAHARSLWRGTLALSRSTCALQQQHLANWVAQVELERRRERARVSACNKARQESALDRSYLMRSQERKQLPFARALSLSFSVTLRAARSLWACLISTGTKLTQLETWVSTQGCVSLRAAIRVFAALPFSDWAGQDRGLFLSLSLLLALSLAVWHASNLISVLINLAKLDDRTDPYTERASPISVCNSRTRPYSLAPPLGSKGSVGRSVGRWSRPLKRNALACACHQTIDAKPDRAY